MGFTMMEDIVEKRVWIICAREDLNQHWACEGTMVQALNSEEICAAV